MSNDLDALGVLGEAGAINLLTLIQSKKEIRTVDVRDITGGYYRLKKVLEDLEKIGLIKIETVEKPYLTYLYRLTPKGKRVAEKLNEIDRIITGD